MTEAALTAGEAQDFSDLASSKGERRKGLWVAGAFFIGLLGWGSLFPLDAGAVANGVIAVSGNRQVVQHQFGGVISALSVQEGQTVQKGDVLVQISGGQVLAAERGMTSEYFTLLAQRSRIEAELRGSNVVQIPVEFQNLTPIDQALADQAMQVQRALLSAKAGSTANQRSILAKRAGQDQSQIDAYEKQITANREQRRLIEDELVGLRKMAEKGFYPINRVREVERAAAGLDGNYGSLRADVARTGQAIGETQMQGVSLRSQRVESAANELRDVQARISELQPKLFATREQVSQSFIRATASGKVVGLKVNTVGGLVAPGQTLMEIVPQNRELVIEAKLSPADADDVRLGMQSQIRLSGVQDRSLPILMGTVSRVSADSLEDPRTGQHYFTMEVTVPETELAKVREAHKGVSLTAGLPADVMVKLRARSALSYLTEPLTKMLWTSGHEQ
jgi:HlyD family secretion protein